MKDMRKLEIRNEKRELKEGLDYVKRGVKKLKKLKYGKNGNLNFFNENKKIRNECIEIIDSMDIFIYD